MFTFCIVLSLFSAQIVYAKADSPINQINTAPEQHNNQHPDRNFNGINFDNVQLFKDDDNFYQSRRQLPQPQTSKLRSNVELSRNSTTPSTWLNTKPSNNTPKVYHLMVGPNKFKLINASDVRFISKKPVNPSAVSGLPGQTKLISSSAGSTVNVMFQSQGSQIIPPLCGSYNQYLYPKPSEKKPTVYQNLTLGGNSFVSINNTKSSEEAASKQPSTNDKKNVVASQTAGNGKVVINNSSSLGPILGNDTGFILSPNNISFLINKTLTMASTNITNDQKSNIMIISASNSTKTNNSAVKVTNTQTKPKNTATAVKGNGTAFAYTGSTNKTPTFVSTSGSNKSQQISTPNFAVNGASTKGSIVFVSVPQKGAKNKTVSQTNPTTNNKTAVIANSNQKSNFGTTAENPNVPKLNGTPVKVNPQQQNPSKAASAMLNQAAKLTNSNLPAVNQPIFINPLTPTRRESQAANSGQPYPISYRMGGDEAFQKPLTTVEHYPEGITTTKGNTDDILLELFRNISQTNYLNHWIGKKMLNETLHHTEQNRQIVESNCKILDVLLKQSKQ